MKKWKSGRRMLNLLAISVASLWAAAGASAASLDLMLEDAPDILTLGVNVDYNANTDVLNVTGLAFQLDTGSSLENISNGQFVLQADVDQNGSLTVGSGSTLSITGTVGGFSGDLLTGNLTAFGFDESGAQPRFEFLFDVTGGHVGASYPAGAQGGVIITNDIGFAPDFSFINSFSNNGASTADTAPYVVPVPAALPMGIVLMAGSVVASYLRGRRRETDRS